MTLALQCLASAAQPCDGSGDLLGRASTLLTRHDAAGAYALLAEAEPQCAGDPAFDYLLGIAALDAGHFTRAVFALERAVQERPGDSLAHAELGRAYLAAGDADAARAQMKAAREGELPEGASLAIERVLGVIDQVAPPGGPQLYGYLEFGGGYDSNVNSATNQGEFAIPAFGGILFQTSPESRRRNDLVAIAAGGVAAELALSPVWKLVAAGNVRGTVDRTVHEMNTVFADATLAVRRAAGTQSQTLALQNGTAWVGGRQYRSANGLNAQWQQQFGPAMQANVFGQWSNQTYRGQAERNTDRSVLGLGFGREIPSLGALAYGSAYLARERAKNPGNANFGHHAAGLRLGLDKRVGAAATLFSEWQYERRRYGGTEPFFDIARLDHQSDIGAGVRLDAGDRWQLALQLRRTRAASNVVLYDYSRNVFQITAHRNFP